MVSNFDETTDLKKGDITNQNLTIHRFNKWADVQNLDVALVNIKANSLQTLNSNIKKYLDTEDKVVGVFFFGHGKVNQINLNKFITYDGQQLARIFDSFLESNINKSKELFVYIESCSGACKNKNSDSLLNNFLSNIKNKKYTINAVAHPYYSYSIKRLDTYIPSPLHATKTVTALVGYRTQLNLFAKSKLKITNRDLQNFLFYAPPFLLAMMFVLNTDLSINPYIMSAGGILSFLLFYSEEILHSVITVKSNKNPKLETESTITKFLKKHLSPLKCNKYFSK